MRTRSGGPSIPGLIRYTRGRRVGWGPFVVYRVGWQVDTADRSLRGRASGSTPARARRNAARRIRRLTGVVDVSVELLRERDVDAVPSIS